MFIQSHPRIPPALERKKVAMRASWLAFGAILGPSWGSFEPSWGHLGASMGNVLQRCFCMIHPIHSRKLVQDVRSAMTLT